MRSFPQCKVSFVLPQISSQQSIIAHMLSSLIHCSPCQTTGNFLWASEVIKVCVLGRGGGGGGVGGGVHACVHIYIMCAVCVFFLQSDVKCLS